MSAFGNNLKKARSHAHLTQQDVADRFGVTRGAVAQWESGEVYPETSRLPEIAKILNTSIDAMFAAPSEPARDEAAEPPISKFWMVYGFGQREPTYRHSSFQQASDEAKRLASMHHGIKFIVMEAMEAFKADKPRIITIDVRDDVDDIPF